MAIKFSYYLYTAANAAITVEYPEDVLAAKAVALDKTVDELTPDDLKDEFWDYAELPALCAHCAGMGLGHDFSLELGDNWEFDDTP